MPATGNASGRPSSGQPLFLAPLRLTDPAAATSDPTGWTGSRCAMGTAARIQAPRGTRSEDEVAASGAVRASA